MFSKFSNFQILLLSITSLSHVNHQSNNVINYNINHYFIDEFIKSTFFTKKANRFRKKQSKKKLISIDINFEILKLNEQIDKILIKCDKMRILAKKQMKFFEKIVFKIF